MQFEDCLYAHVENDSFCFFNTGDIVIP